MGGQVGEVATYEIINNDGMLIKNGGFSTGVNKTIIDIHELNMGLYTLKIQVGGNIYIGTFVVDA